MEYGKKHAIKHIFYGFDSFEINLLCAKLLF